MVKEIEIMLPKEALYRPPVTIRCLDCRTFGRSTLIGTHIISSIDAFLWEPGATDSLKIDIDEIEEWEDPEEPLLGGTQLGVEGSDEEDVGPPPPSQADLEQFHGVTQMEDEMVEDVDPGFFASLASPDIDEIDEDEENGRQGSWSGSQKTLTNNSNGQDASSETSRTGKMESNGPMGTKAAKDPEEEIPMEAIGDDRDYDHELGSTRPLPLIKKQPKPTDDKNAKQKKPEEEVKLDWWSKYYASVKDKEEERRKNQIRPKARKKKRPLKKMATYKMMKILNKTIHTAAMIKERTIAQVKSRNGKANDNDVPVKKQLTAMTDMDSALLARLEILENELELEPRFGGFRDTIQSFRLYRGKKTFSEFDERNRYVGSFKGNLRICLAPPPKMIAEHGFFSDLPSPEPTKVIVRVYVVKANNLRPADASGKADPYLALSIGKNKIKDKAHRILNQLDPVFGRMFEFDATFPPDTELTVQLFDWDRISQDDLLGETKIDLEQRFLSRHRAGAGLPFKYERSGYNAWRDYRKPSQILAALCKTHTLRGPFYKHGQVLVGSTTFTAPKDKLTDELLDSENVALYALHHWEEVPEVGYPLVPEHVERRTLYHPDHPGVDQGNVDMWVDIFPRGPSAMGPAIDITPRKPKKYVLRVFIWSTKNVLLDDANIVTGTDSVDQYVKGFIIGPDVDCQQTDVHYRSLNGEGLFNWRFIYNLEYLDAEDKLVYKTKARFFSLAEHEEKIPPKLSLQVWDADTFSADDYLGSLILDLNRLPRGAKSARTCSLHMLDPDNDMPTASLFRIKRTRGWWPFVQYNEDGEPTLAGKVDLELQLVSEEEAEKRPAGQGREAPDPMPEPQRPETSFAWFASPLKFLKFSVWQGMRYRCLVFLIVLLLLAFLGAFIYTLPEAAAQKIVGSA